MANNFANNKAHGQHDSVSGQAYEAFGESSVCAVSSILSTDNKPRRIFRSVVFVLFTIAFFWQFFAFLSYVGQHPTIVDHEILRPEEFVAPAYTFCNFNLIKRSKYCEKYPRNCTRPDRDFCFDNPRFCGTPDTKIVRDLITDLESPDHQYQLRHELEDMIYLGEEEEDIAFGPLPRHTSEAGVGACFSFNDRVASSSDPVMKKRTPFGNAITERFSFDPEENEAIYPEWKTGIVFDVHSPFEGSNPFVTGVYMQPGHHYTISVKMTQEELLPNDCLDYTEVWMKNGKEGYRSQASCKHKCYGDVTLKCLNCSEPNVLYPFPNISLCNFRTGKRFEEKCSHPEDEVIECLKECKEECLKTKFSYDVKETYMNSYALRQDVNASRRVIVEVEFVDGDIQKIVRKRQFQVLEVFGLIGGLLAFWIGLSMYQVVEVLDCIFQIGRYLFNNRSSRSGSSSA